MIHKCHDAASGLDIDHIVLPDCHTNRDTGIHVSGKINIPKSASVDPPCFLLQFFNGNL